MIEISFEIIKLDEQQNIQPVVNAYIDTQKIRLVIDTGASRSCLSQKSIKHIKTKNELKADAVIGIGRGRLKNRFVQIPNFKIGELEIKNYNFLALQMNHINKMLSSLGMEKIDGMLGSDILYEYKAVIDYVEQKIIFNI